MAISQKDIGFDVYTYKPLPAGRGVWIAATVVLLTTVGVVLYVLSFDTASNALDYGSTQQMTIAPTHATVAPAPSSMPKT